MTKKDAYCRLQQISINRGERTGGIGFVANVILTSYGKGSARMLKTLVKLADEGHEIGAGSFSIEHFSLDGSIQPISNLLSL